MSLLFQAYLPSPVSQWRQKEVENSLMLPHPLPAAMSASRIFLPISGWKPNAIHYFTVPSGSLSCPTLLFSVASVLSVSLFLFLLSSSVLPANTSDGVIYAEANPHGSETVGHANGRVCLGRWVWPRFTNHKQPQMWTRVFQGRHAWSILYLLTLLYVILRSQKSEFFI